ncbi:hypothetical protein [Rheinheimera texasensis]|uniref:hypothetical protein n=1 Tax=Rheinheimera texasensis TaxID=306205 RepID=UPI0004E24B4F|nr:hypothetical protein [Rheinheimera texasensis]
MDLLFGFLLGCSLLGGGTLYWHLLSRSLAPRHSYPLWLSVPVHQLLTLAVVVGLGVTPAQGWFSFTLFCVLVALLLGLLLLPILMFLRYVERCRPLQDKI